MCIVLFQLAFKVTSCLFLINCFSDIDECATETHNCSDRAMCNNTKGGHNCTCKKGFIGDGENCTGNTFAFALVMLKNAVFLFLEDDWLLSIKSCFFVDLWVISLYASSFFN